ncbi:MAG: hypothetical protein JSV22_07025 [Bacteroidales bacterium]|nr:MAG: hypothetical protein JSV22_07025 [Bacteroidales bacterium]
MEKAHIYIKKILFIGICTVIGYILSDYFALYYIIPVLLLVFSLADFKITGRKPEYLFNFKRTEEYFKKGGLRDLIRILVSLLAFTYDTLVWIIWGVYLIFELLAEVLFLLRNIFFWIVFGIIWFLKLFVPPLVILFKLIIHYLIKWIWWIYKISFKNFVASLRKEYYFTAAKGIVLSIFTVFLFYFIGIVVDINGLIYIGIILSLLPVTWVFGEISLTISKSQQDREDIKALNNYNNGLESVRSILFYITIIIVLFIVQVLFNLLGWIPESGLSFLGLSLNINTFITLILIFLAVLTVFGVLIIPTHRLFNIFREVSIKDSVSLLEIIFRKGLQYILLIIPSSFFSTLLVIIPVIIVFIALRFTLFIKDGVIDARIEDLKRDQIETEDELENYKIQKGIANLRFYKEFPFNVFVEIDNRSGIENNIREKREALSNEETELKLIENETVVEIEQIDEQINNELRQNENSALVTDLRSQKLILEENLSEIKSVKELVIQKLLLDIDDLENYKIQLLITFFFTGIWISIFGGLVLAFVFAYLANAFYEMYLFRNDNSPSYWRLIFTEEKEKDSKQPLIGFTLLIIFILLFYYLFSYLDLSGNFQLSDFF